MLRSQVQLRIVAGDAFAQGEYAGLQRVPVLLLLNYAHGFAANHFRRRQIGLAQTETDAARLRAIRDLPDHALFDAAQEWRWLKCFQRKPILVDLLACSR